MTGRIDAIDVFRGLTIVLMTIVNNPGSWDSVYGPLLHASWHGWTPTDLVFPFFVFIVGVVVPIAFTRKLEKGTTKRELISKLSKRTLILFGIGLFLAAFPFVQLEPSFSLRSSFTKLRIFGVLQRIALCYLAASICFLFLKRKGLITISILILLGYYLAMQLVPVPGHGAGLLDSKEYNLAAFIDRMIVGENHLWAGADRRWDPEGLLSTFPAIVSSLMGVLAGMRLLKAKSMLVITLEFFVGGTVLLFLGYLWGWGFPINKALWTSSYVLFTAGIALLVLATCIWWLDVRKAKLGRQFFIDFGINAITVYAGTSLLAQCFALWGWSGWLFENVFSLVGIPKLASLLSALMWVALWYLGLRVMRARGIKLSI